MCACVRVRACVYHHRIVRPFEQRPRQRQLRKDTAVRPHVHRRPVHVAVQHELRRAVVPDGQQFAACCEYSEHPTFAMRPGFVLDPRTCCARLPEEEGALQGTPPCACRTPLNHEVLGRPGAPQGTVGCRFRGGGGRLDVMYVMRLSPGFIRFAEPKSESLRQPVAA